MYPKSPRHTFKINCYAFVYPLYDNSYTTEPLVPSDITLFSNWAYPRFRHLEVTKIGWRTPRGARGHSAPQGSCRDPPLPPFHSLLLYSFLFLLGCPCFCEVLNCTLQGRSIYELWCYVCDTCSYLSMKLVRIWYFFVIVRFMRCNVIKFSLKFSFLLFEGEFMFLFQIRLSKLTTSKSSEF